MAGMKFKILYIETTKYKYTFSAVIIWKYCIDYYTFILIFLYQYFFLCFFLIR